MSPDARGVESESRSFSRMALAGMIVLLGILVSSCATSVERDWKVTNLSLGNSQISISFPNGESADFPPGPVLNPVEFPIDKARLFEGHLTVLRKHWDFGKGSFKGVDGTLIVGVNVALIPDDLTPKPVTDEARLAAFVYKDSPDDEGTSKPQSLVVNNIHWIIVEKIPDTKYDNPITGYYALLDDSHALYVYAVYLDNSKGSQLDWVDDAVKIFQEIMGTVEIKSD